MNKSEYQKLIREANVFVNSNKLEEAAKCLEKSFEYGVDINIVLDLGYIYLDLQKYPRCEELFSFALHALPSPKGYYGYGLLKERLGLKQEAITNYEEAIKYDNTPGIVYFDCAHLYDDLGEYEKAKAYYLKAIELKENLFWSNLNLGSIYERENNNDLALKYFQAAYDIDPNKPYINFNLGVVYTKLHRKDEALAAYLREATINEHYHFTYYNLGLLYKDEFHDLEKAKEAYLLGLKEEKDNYYIWYNLGCVYSLLHDYDNAYDCFLYLFYKKKKMYKSIMTDEELKDFRNTPQYAKLCLLK